MINSKFKIRAFIIAFLLISLTGLIVFILINIKLFSLAKIIFYAFFLGISWIFLFYGELRTKAISFTIDPESITIRRYWGLGKKKEYSLSCFDGFKTSLLRSNAGTYEYLYLMIGDKKIVKISAYYHRNYLEIKKFLNHHIKNLGFEPFSLIDEIKEIFI